MRVTRFLFLLFFLAINFLPAAFAQESRLYGPEKFIRTQATTDTFTATFPAFAREGILRLTNCSPNATLPLSSSRIWFNGNLVFWPQRLSRATTDVKVTFAESNTLTVQLNTGRAGSFITIEAVLPFFEDVPGWRMPELAVTSLSVTPERANPGEPIVLQATAANTGLGTASAATLIFSVDGVRLGGERAIPALAAGQSVTETATWQGQPGYHLVRAELLLPPGAFDSSRSNNSQTATARVSGGATIRRELDISFDPDSLRVLPGQSATLSVRLHNPGFADLVFEPLRFSIDDEMFGTITWIEELLPGQDMVVQLEWPVVTPGEHNIAIYVGGLREDQPEAEWVFAWQLVVPFKTLLFDNPDLDKWSSLGPRYIRGLGGSGQRFGGRMNTVAFDPQSPMNMYVGGFGYDGDIPAGPGVWKSQNGGASWFPVGDKLPSMLIRSIAVDPQIPDIVYAAGPDGLFKSTDAGINWYEFANPATVGKIMELVVKTTSAGEVLIYAAGSKGLLRYTDPNHYKTSSLISQWDVIKQGVVRDIAVHPTDISTLYIAVEKDGFYRTHAGEIARKEITPGDHDFVKLTDGLPPITGIFLSLDVHPLYPWVIYAGIYQPDSASEFGLFRSVDEGEHWSVVQKYPTGSLQGMYAVHVAPIGMTPTQTVEAVYLSGIHLYQYVSTCLLVADTQSCASGTYIVPKSEWDMKALEFDPYNRSGAYYSICDQGVFHCTINLTPKVAKYPGQLIGESGDICQDYNYNLRTAEIYDFDVSAMDSNLIIAGTQDTGTILYRGDNLIWDEVKGGDGNYSLIHPTNPQIMYAQYQFLDSTVRSSDGGISWPPIGAPLEPAMGVDCAYITYDSFSEAVLAPACSNKLSLLRPTFYSEVNLSTYGINGLVTRVLFHPGSNAWVLGTSDGRVYFLTKVNPTATLLFTHPNKGLVSRMVFSGADPNLILISFTTPDANQRIYIIHLNPANPGISTSQGITDKSNLPTNLSIYAIAGDAYDSGKVYLGTNKGVWRYYKPGSGMFPWKAYNEGLPLTSVTDLAVAPDKALLAATKGRGVWKVVTGP